MSCAAAAVPIPDASAPPPFSTITIEIGIGGALQKLDFNLRKEDALQAIHALAMAHLRALDLLTH